MIGPNYIAQAAGLDGAPPSDRPTSRPRPLTDLGNAERLVDRYGDRIRYVVPEGYWIIWDGRRWARDHSGEIERLAKETVRAIYDEARDAPSRDERAALARHASRSEANARIRAMLERARVEPGIPIRSSELDRDPWLLCVANGTLDLRTGTLREHRPADLITMLADVPYDPAATCPRWLAFLDRVFGGDAEMIEFVRRAVGYSLTGDTSEHAMLLCHGRGANGKSTMLLTLRRMLGDYAAQADPSSFLDARREGPRNDLAALVGKRLVVALEVGEAKRLDEPLVKHLTGGDVVRVRRLYEESFEYVPAFKIWLGTNPLPVVRGSDDCIWRRIRRVPFNVVIPEAERDPHLAERLAAELSGVLVWAVQGCLAWQREGLPTPAAVRAATEQYREQSDHVGAFLTECARIDPAARVSANALYRAFVEWMERNGRGEMSQHAFGRKLTDMGFGTAMVGRGRQRTTYRLGLALADEPSPDPGEGVHPCTPLSTLGAGSPTSPPYMHKDIAKGCTLDAKGVRPTRLVPFEEEAAVIAAYERAHPPPRGGR